MADELIHMAIAGPLGPDGLKTLQTACGEPGEMSFLERLRPYTCPECLAIVAALKADQASLDDVEP